jgi:CBS domain-containing protein
MTENPEAVTPGTTLADAARKMRDLNVGILPVVDDLDNRRLQGVITDRDIAVRAVAEGKGGTARVEQCMTLAVESCHPDDRVRDVIHVMEREQVRRVPIVDHAGSLVGIIAQADLAVDFAEGEEHRELRVGDAIERISEPAGPRRGRGGYRRMEENRDRR